MASPALLTVEEVAERLRVTERMVRRLVACGLLAAIRISGRTLRIEEQSLDAYMEAHRVRRVIPSPRRAEAWKS